jgi:hypothetical protein
MSKFNSLLKLSKIFLTAQKRKEINVEPTKQNWLNHQWDTDRDTGEFYGDTFVGTGIEYQHDPYNTYPDPPKFPKSKYQEHVEFFGDQKIDLDSVEKMSKAAQKAFVICAGHISKNWLPLTMFAEELKNKYKMTGSSSLDRLLLIYKKYSGLKRKVDPWFSTKTIDSNNANILIEKSIKTMEFVKNFFEDFKILFEILKFEDVSMELPTKNKWPIGEEFDFESGGKNLVTPKEDLQDMCSFIRDEIQETLEKLYEQIQIFEKNKVDVINEPEK